VYKVLVGKAEGKRPLGRPRHRWDLSHSKSHVSRVTIWLPTALGFAHHKIFRTGAAIYIAVVVARSTGPNRPNNAFRVLLRLLQRLRENLRRRRPELW
jgi:hypothetical protein